jgi:hypothetical protein
MPYGVIAPLNANFLGLLDAARTTHNFRAKRLSPPNGRILAQPHQLHLRSRHRLPVRIHRFAVGNQRSHSRLVRFRLGPFYIAFGVPVHCREMSTRCVEVMLHRFQMSLSRRFDGTFSFVSDALINLTTSSIPRSCDITQKVRQFLKERTFPPQSRKTFFFDLLEIPCASADLMSAIFDKARASFDRFAASS